MTESVDKGLKDVGEKDYRGIAALVVLIGTFFLVGYAMVEGREIPDVFLGALSSAWGAIIAWYFFKK